MQLKVIGKQLLRFVVCYFEEPIARKVIDFNRNCGVEVYLIDLKLCHNDNLDSCLTEYFSVLLP